MSDEEYYTKYNGNHNELVRAEAKTYNEFKESANALNSSLEYRIVNCTDGGYTVKERVTFLEAMTEMPQKVKDALKNTIVSVGAKGSAYDPASDTIFIGKNAKKTKLFMR